MLSFFRRRRDSWNCDTDEVPSPGVLRAQRDVLRGSKQDTKLQVLQLLLEFSKDDEGQPDKEMQDVLLNAGVTAEVAKLFVAEPGPVQTTAARVLTALCKCHEPTSSAVLADVLPTAFTAVQAPNAQPTLSLLALDLLTALVSGAPLLVADELVKPGSITLLLKTAAETSRLINHPSTKSDTAIRLETFLSQLLACLWACAAQGSKKLRDEMGKALGLRTLLEVVRMQQGAAVRENALGLLSLLLEQSRGARPRLVDPETDGVTVLMGLLRDTQLGWSAKQRACQALCSAAGARLVAEFIVTSRGLDDLLRLCEAALAAITSPQTQTQQTPQKAASTAPTTTSSAVGQQTPSKAAAEGATAASPLPGRARRSAAAAAPSSPAGVAAAAHISSPGGGGGGGGDGVGSGDGGIGQVRSAAYAALEELLAVLAAVARHRAYAGKVVEAQRPRGLLSRLFGSAMADFRGGGHRLAVAVAQVYLELANACSGDAKLLAAAFPQGTGSAAAVSSAINGVGGVGSGGVLGPLAALVDRGVDYAALDGARAAHIVHGAWCAAGTICKVLSERRRVERESDGASPGSAISLVTGDTITSLPHQVPGVVRLLNATAAALMAVLTGSGCGEDVLSLAGAVYLAADQPRADLGSALQAVCHELAELAAGGSAALRQALGQQAGAAEGLRRVKDWPPVQWHAKRALYLLGDSSVEYQPFVRYGAPLLAALLARQGVDPGPFTARKVDAYVLLGLKPDFMTAPQPGGLGLDEVQVIRVIGIQAGHELFNVMDSCDGRVSGTVGAADMQAYLCDSAGLREATAEDIVGRVFERLQVPLDQPLSFLQFMDVYPELESELAAFGSSGPATMPVGGGGMHAPGGSGAGGSGAVAGAAAGAGVGAAGGVGLARPAKRQRLQGGGGGSGPT